MQKITCCPHLKLQHGESCGMELPFARKCTLQKAVHFWSDVGTEKKNSVWRLHVVQHLGMPVHKEQAGVFCLIRDLFPPRTPSALFQALSRHSRLAGNQAWVSGISLSCREDDSQPQAREWMRLFHYSLGGLDLLGRGNGRSGKGLFFFYSLVLSPTGQQLVERSCGQQCSSLVCPMRLRKAFVVHSAMCLRRPRAEANYLGCFSLGW